MKWGIICNFHLNKAISLSSEIYDFLSDKGEIFAEDCVAKRKGVKGHSHKEINKESDIVITIGGDGTILRALENIDKPIFAINSGGMGFLTEVESKDALKELNLLTIKPMLYCLNVSEEDVSKNHDDLIAKAGMKKYKDATIVICARLESELASLSNDEMQEYLISSGITQTALDQLIVTAYHTLDLITFLTAGPQESRAWTVTKGSVAPIAAGRIHTDFEKGFIRAEVISYDNYVSCGSENNAKEKGLMHVEGKEYIVQDGDVIYFRVST